MVNERYLLFYQDLELGEVTEEDADFPGASGTIRLNEKRDNAPLRNKIQQYIEYSIAESEFVEEKMSAEQQTRHKEHSLRYSNGKIFLDLIESDDWFLVNERERRPILIPVFCDENSIVWRENFFGHEE